MALPSKADLFLYQGDTWSAQVTISGASAPDLQGYTGLAQIRRDYADREPDVAATMTAVVTGSKTVNISLSDEVTTKLYGDYVWDMRLVAGDGSVTTVLAGEVRVDPDVTRPPT